MMATQRGVPTITVEAAIGFAAAPNGDGVAYARLGGSGGDHLLRLPFRVGPQSGIQPREAGYAAVTAVARALRTRGVRRATLRLDDSALIADLESKRSVPAAIALANVRLRCALNALERVQVEFAVERDLAQRAQAEVVLNAAA